MISDEGVVVLVGITVVWMFVWLFIVRPVVDLVVGPGWRRVLIGGMATFAAIALLAGIFFGQLYVTLGG